MKTKDSDDVYAVPSTNQTVSVVDVATELEARIADETLIGYDSS